MNTRQFTGNPSEVIIEQLVALGVNYLFFNPGSREAPFFDALQRNTKIDGILALHEGSVTAMAGGYTQVDAEPAVMVVHLGSGLAQCLGQLINIWTGSLPVVVITFAGDPGSFADRVYLDLTHDAGPTAISAPLTKANWTVIEPEGLASAIERAILVAKTPPVGPVHIAVYDRLLNNHQFTTQIVGKKMGKLRSGYPPRTEIKQVAQILHEAERPLIYVSDGVWKSGAEDAVVKLAEYFGIPVSTIFADLKSFPITHPLHCGRFAQAVEAFNPDYIVCIGLRHSGDGSPDDYSPFINARKVVAIGSDGENLVNIPGLDIAILGDELRSIENINKVAHKEYDPSNYIERRKIAKSTAAKLREERRQVLKDRAANDPTKVSPLAVIDALDSCLEKLGGGFVTTEQFAVPLDCVQANNNGGSNVYLRPPGGSEGYGMAAPIGVKLAAPNKPVVGLVGDGSVYYADSAFYTSVYHRIPVLWVIPNNSSYGIVANAFGSSGGEMHTSGTYSGVALHGIDPVKIANAYGVDGASVDDEKQIYCEMERSLQIVEQEKRPYLLNIRLPLGLPDGGTAAEQYRFV